MSSLTKQCPHCGTLSNGYGSICSICNNTFADPPSYNQSTYPGYQPPSMSGHEYSPISYNAPTQTSYGTAPLLPQNQQPSNWNPSQNFNTMPAMSGYNYQSTNVPLQPSQQQHPAQPQVLTFPSQTNSQVTVHFAQSHPALAPTPTNYYNNCGAPMAAFSVDNPLPLYSNSIMPPPIFAADAFTVQNPAELLNGSGNVDCNAVSFSLNSLRYPMSSHSAFNVTRKNETPLLILNLLTWVPVILLYDSFVHDSDGYFSYIMGQPALLGLNVCAAIAYLLYVAMYILPAGCLPLPFYTNYSGGCCLKTPIHENLQLKSDSAMKVLHELDSISSLPYSFTLKTKAFHIINSSSMGGVERVITAQQDTPISVVAAANVGIEPNGWVEWIRDVRPSNPVVWSKEVELNGAIRDNTLVNSVEYYRSACASYMVEYTMSYQVDPSQQAYINHLKQTANYSLKTLDMMVHSYLSYKPAFPDYSQPNHSNWDNGKGEFVYGPRDRKLLKEGLLGERDSAEYRMSRMSLVVNPDKIWTARLKGFFFNYYCMFICMYAACYFPYIVCWRWCYPTYTYNHRRKLILGKAGYPVRSDEDS